ncbi:MAG: polysaccharide biosynthesis C-terminal domain-containing protein [Candidatus ainarchaeum sp.]|nr:polysaccharide biosynthesis C-terminal domain-containing protein [Candidatus ainarchaeum sp.]
MFHAFFAYIFLAGPFFGNSLNEAVKKEVTIYKFNEKSYNYIKEAFKLKICFFLFATIILITISFFIKINILSNNLFWFIILLFLMNFWGFIVSIFESTHRLFYVFLIYLIEYSIKISLIIYFTLINNLNFTTITIAFIFGYLFALITGLFILKKQFIKKILFKNNYSNLNLSKKILIRSLFLGLSSISLIILSKIDVVMISYFLNIKSVGFYTIAADITKQATIISIPILLGSLPLFINKKYDSKKLFKNIFKKIIIINTLLFIFFIIFSDILIKTIYGSEFGIVSNLIYILSFFPLLSCLIIFNQNLLILKDEIKIIFFSGIIIIILNISLNFILVMPFGIIGIAIATIISYLIWAIILFKYTQKVYEI